MPNLKMLKKKMPAINARRLLLLRNNILRLLLLRRRQKRRRKYRRRFWVRRIYAEREQKGEYHFLKLYDQEYFFQCFRMTTFEQLLSWIGPHLPKTTTKMREPIAFYLVDVTISTRGASWD